jgi:hypothetical protein
MFKIKRLREIKKKQAEFFKEYQINESDRRVGSSAVLHLLRNEAIHSTVALPSLFHYRFRPVL